MRRTLAALAAAALMASSMPAALPAADAPESWRDEDVAVNAAVRHGVEAGRFLSRAMASGVERTLRDLGFTPVLVVEDPLTREVRVLVGDTPDIVDAWGLHEELVAQGVVDGIVVVIPPEGLPPTPGNFSGPLLPAFTPTRADAFPLPSDDEALKAVAERRVVAPTSTENPTDEVGDLLRARDFSSARLGDAIIATISNPRLRFSKGERLVVSQRIARGEWAAGEEARSKARTICADLYLLGFNDWRAAWRATAEVATSTGRTRDEQAEDALRRAALAMDLLRRPPMRGEATVPLSFVRSELRRAQLAAEDGSRRLQARIALMYLRTFLLEANWERAVDVGVDMQRRFQEEGPFTQLALIYTARALEATMEYDRALAMLDAASGIYVAPPDRIEAGGEVIDTHEMARQWRRYYQALKSGIASPPRPAEIALEGDVSGRATAAAQADPPASSK